MLKKILNAALKLLITALGLVALIVLVIALPEVFMLIAGIIIGIASLLLWSVFFKDLIAHDPDKPGKLAWFVEVPQNRSVVINRGGRPTHVLRGDEDPTASSACFGLWMLYKSYVMKVTGYHVYFPFFYTPTVYDLPRYRVREKDGKKIFEVVEEGSKGYRSNHVRTEFTTWYFEYAGAEIQKIPFTVKGSVQIKITKGKEIAALYDTDSWNVLLDQALNSVIRAVVRRDMTLDMVIGSTNNDLWKEPTSKQDPYAHAATLIMDRLHGFTIDGVALTELGIEIKRVDIIDFADELSEDESRGLRRAVLEKEAAKALELKGRAEAANTKRAGQADAVAIRARGKATAEAQEKLVEVHKANPEIAGNITQADALRAFAENGGSILDGVAAAFVKGGKKNG